MRPLFAALSIFCLGACDVPYPDDSYKPKYADDDSDDSDGDDQGDDDEEDAGAEPVRDARVIPPKEGGAGRSDGGAGRSDAQANPANPLAALEGRYLMRMDLYSTARKDGTIDVEVKNRVSNLVLVDLVADGDGLSGSEILCGQTYAHQCVRGCNGWTTAVSGSVADKYFGDPERAVERAYTLTADGELKGEASTFVVGFDPQGDNTSLPSLPSDSRVWRTEAGAGLHASSMVMATVLGRAMTISCRLSSVLLIKTSFTGKLGRVSRDAFKDTKFSLSTADSSGAVIDVTGTPMNQCTKSNFSSASSTGPQQATLRMVPTDAAGCPSPREFDQALPPAPAFM